MCFFFNGIDTLGEDTFDFDESIFEGLECCGESVFESADFFFAAEYVLCIYWLNVSVSFLLIVCCLQDDNLH